MRMATQAASLVTGFPREDGDMLYGLVQRFMGRVEGVDGMTDDDETLDCSPAAPPPPPQCGIGPVLALLLPVLAWAGIGFFHDATPAAGGSCMSFTTGGLERLAARLNRSPAAR